MGERRGVYRGLVGKPEGKRPVGRPRRRWEDNIKADFWTWDVGVWTGLSWLRIKILLNYIFYEVTLHRSMSTLTEKRSKYKIFVYDKRCGVH
jgi:hypothetical protein